MVTTKLFNPVRLLKFIPVCNHVLYLQEMIEYYFITFFIFVHCFKLLVGTLQTDIVKIDVDFNGFRVKHNM